MRCARRLRQSRSALPTDLSPALDMVAMRGVRTRYGRTNPNDGSPMSPLNKRPHCASACCSGGSAAGTTPLYQLN